jgi:hypothetical protein
MRRVPVWLTCAVVATVLGTYAPSAAAAPHAPPPPPVATAAGSDLSDQLCDLLNKPVSYVTNRLAGWISGGRIRGTLAGSLFSELAFNPWCKSKLPRLRSALLNLSSTRPAYKASLGPWVFGIQAALTNYATTTRAAVSWRSYGFGTLITDYKLWYRATGGRWYQASSVYISLRRNYQVQFAVRVINARGVSSPYVYSGWYRT